IPGATYRIGAMFANQEMPEDSPFRVAWWYRIEFDLPAGNPDDRIRLHLDGVNYRANVWLNGQRVATADEIAGAYRIYALDVTAAAHSGHANALALEVFAPQAKDLAISFVDWNPTPPDKNMGLWQGVWLSGSGPVAIRHPHVISHLDRWAISTASGSAGAAHLTVGADLKNGSDSPASGTLDATIKSPIEDPIKESTGEIHIRQSVLLQPHEEKHVIFTPESFPALNITHPRVWWPYQMGSPELYDLKLEFTIAPDVAHAKAPPRLSDSQYVSFGISQITSELTPEGHRLFRVNGRRLLVRGAAWTPDILQRRSTSRLGWMSPGRLEAEFSYVRGMNLNTIRLEGKMDEDYFFDLADRMGILVLPGWCCCDAWQNGAKWDDDTRRIAAASLTDQLRRLRNHPSVLAWLNGSDEAPPPDIERMYLDIEKQLDWPKPILSAASARTTPLSGASGVKMAGPYDTVPPVYWYTDKNNGGAFGFSTEISQGPAIPQIESLRRFLPAASLWPINDDWDYHAGGGQFKNINRFTHALEQRYGASANLEDYVWKAQAAAYDGERAMFEAYARNKYRSTGVIHWMLSGAWPSLIWNLYDYYLRPHAGYFGTKKACEPLHIQYSYDDQSIVVVSDAAKPVTGLRVKAAVYNLDLTEKFRREAPVDVPADAALRAFTLPKLEGLSTTYFLRLRLENAKGEILSRNFYWLSTVPDRLDWPHTTYFYTPLESPADLRALNSLPPATVRATASFFSAEFGRNGTGIAHVRLENTGKTLAFLLRLKVTCGKSGEEILPVLWDDNYFELFPGETRELHASYHLQDCTTTKPEVEVTAWNVNRKP
ncbi:MAG TPA: hypothetical protein VKG84_14845, partial [Candidatus Acidoferrales bacterium]|nr:hypothetical protein [Candidatus Acidoferrales bacterium]